jgi:peptidoglycan hydrolase-like protein with peptidoglycan-binding domain
MIKTSLVPAALAVAGLVALAGCSSGANHPMTQTSSAPPAASPAPSATMIPEVSPDLIKRVQTALQQQGFYKGSIDGVWGPHTQRAVHGYQQSHNLTVNGELDSQTLTSLKTASAGSEQPVPLAMAPAMPPATSPMAPSATAPAAPPATSTTAAPATTATP